MTALLTAVPLTDEHTDREVIDRILEGDRNLFQQLMDRYGHDIITLVARHVPHDAVIDVVQEVFIAGFKSLRQFEGKSTFKHWLRRIAVRMCCNYWRRHYQAREVPLTSLDETHTHWVARVIATNSRTSYEEFTRRSEAKEILEWALAQLKADERIVLQLVHLDGCPVSEVADMLDWSRAKVKVKRFRSRQKLRKILATILPK
jgi:RNA polymerase sigma-70 factor, ECF subfamily